tara:strand:- start:382 stop:1530 length:1149 start_codon:yes stop_codon:yes gene_type:complete
MAINYTYPSKGSPTTADDFLIIDNEDARKPTKRINIGNIISLGVSQVTGTSPISASPTNGNVVLSLGTVPTTNGGTGLTTLGSAHQTLVVNNGGTALEYKDVTIIERVKNTTASTITKGTPVHATGWSESDGAAEVEPADATNGSTDLMPCIGLAEEDIAVGTVGPIIVVGVLESIATNSYGVEVGDVLYVAPGGGLTGTRPTGTNIIQPVAVILKKAGSGGGVLQVASVSQGASIPNVQNGEIIVGDASNVGQSVAMSGEVTINNNGVTSIIGIDGNISIQGYRPITEVTASGSITFDDNGKTLVATNGPGAVDIGLTDSGDFEVGTEIQVIRKGAGGVQISPGGSTAINGSLFPIVIAAQYDSVTLKKYATNDWLAFGDI